MPRRTPVRELQNEEVAPSSPVRRSSRLNTSSPVPTKVLSRRNSSSEEPSQTPKLTRSRRLSLTQETDAKEELDKKKSTSTIRTRRSSLTLNKDEEVVEPVRATRAKTSSATKEDTPTVKRVTRLRRSTSEEPVSTEETTKKVTRSRSASSTKNNESDDTKAIKKLVSAEAISASTPVKKSGSISESLESIEEANKEVDSPVEIISVKSKRKTMEASKVDFDLSIITELSITEEDEEGSPKKKTKVEDGEGSPKKKTKIEDEEGSPKKKTKVEDEEGSPKKKTKVEDEEGSPKKKTNVEDEEGSPKKKTKVEDEKGSPKKRTNVEEMNGSSTETEPQVEAKLQEDSVDTKEDPTDNVTSSEPKKPEPEQKLDTSLAKNKSADIEAYDSASDTSFYLNLSSLQESIEEPVTVPLDTSDKENVRPMQYPESEPMDVDDSTFSIFSPEQNKSLKVSVGLKTSEIEQKLQHTEKVNDAMAEFLSQEIQINSQDKTTEGKLPEKIQVEVVVATSVAIKDQQKEVVFKENLDSAKEAKKLNQVGKVQVEKPNQEVEPQGEKPNQEQQVEKSKQEKQQAGKSKQEVEQQAEKSKQEVEQLVEKPNQEMEEQIETDTIEETSEQLEEVIEKQLRDSFSETIEEDTKGKHHEEIYVEKQAITDKDMADKAEQKSSKEITKSSQVDDIDTFTRNESQVSEMSAKASPLEEDLNKTKEELMSTNIGVDEDDLTEPETPTSKESSLIVANIPLPNEDKDGIIIDVDEISNDKISLDGDTTLEERNALSEEVEEAINVVDDDLNSKLESFKNVVTEGRPSAEHKKRIIRRSVGIHDHDTDLEVKTINEYKEKTTPRREDSINLCDSDSDVVFNGHESNYASPVKRPKSKSYTGKSDGEIFGIKDQAKDAMGSNIYDRFIDSMFSIGFDRKQAKRETIDSESSDVVVELSDDDKEDENAASSSSGVTYSTLKTNDTVIDDVSDKDRSITVDIVERETLSKDDTQTKEQEASIFANSCRRRSLDKTSITMQETLKAGDNAGKLPDRIHRVVDLFCAGLKNKSDLSVNVSLEYTGQLSDNEDEDNRLEISLVASDIKEQDTSYQKGSKRRRICRDDEAGSNLDDSNANESETHEESTPKTSVSINSEKVSTKKKRKSAGCSEVLDRPDFRSNDVVKSSPKVSFLVTESDISVKKKKNRRSTSEVLDTSQEKERKSSPKKPVPLTPYKITKTSKSKDESGDSAESTDGEEDNDETMVSESQDSKVYENLFLQSFEDDENDWTWGADEEEEASSSEGDSTNDVSVAEDELDVGEEIDLLEEMRKNQMEMPSPILSEDSSDEVFVPDEEQLGSSKKRTRKFFRLSSCNLSKALGSSESEENLSQKEKTKTKTQKAGVEAPVVKEKTKSKKKTNRSFETKDVSNILPETSEVKIKDAKKGRKRRHRNSTSVDENEEREAPATEKAVSKKKRKGAARSGRESMEESVVAIKPSVGKSKNRRALRMKPSTKMCSGWNVTSVP